MNKDLQLVQDAIKGKQKAFTTLFNNYKTYVQNIITIIVKNQTDAEDVTLETFEKAFSKLNSYNSSYSFSTWLYRIAVNTSIDYLRKKKHGPIFTDSIISEFESYVNKIPDSGSSPEDILITEERLKKFKELTNKMNPTFRKMIELRFEQGKSYEDISEELNLKLGTVGAQIHRVRNAMYKTLKDIK